MIRLGKLNVATVAVADSSVTKILDRNDNRRMLVVWNFSGSDVYIGYADTPPADATAMHTLPDSQAISWENAVPITHVYAYQASGASVDLKVQEGE